jgi:hypothetical protein
MKLRSHFFALVALALTLVTASPAFAHIRTWTGVFSPEGDGGRTGSGSLLLEYDEHSNVLTIIASFAGLSSRTTVAHIHCCSGPFPATAGVALAGATNSFGATLFKFPSGELAADYEHNFDMGEASNYSNGFRIANGGTADGARDALLDAFDAKRVYLNIHTSGFPGGEIRAQVVPEPATWALMAFGLVAAGAGVGRRSVSRRG